MKIFSIVVCFLLCACAPKQATLYTSATASVTPVALHGPAPQHTPAVHFKMLHVPSIDAVLRETAQIDKSLVNSRNSLQDAKKSIRSLANGNMDSLRQELRQMLADGTFSLVNKNGLPSLAYNKNKRSARADSVHGSISNLHQEIVNIRSEFPEMKKNVQQLVKKSKRMVNNAPTEVQKAIVSGQLPVTHMANTVQFVNFNVQQIQKVPVHVKELKQEIVHSSQFLRNLLQQ